MISRSVAIPILALCLTAGTVGASPQKKSSSKSSKTPAKASRYHRLPSHYGQLKLKDSQVSEIYTIRDKYGPKIDELAKQLDELKSEQAEEIKDVLTRTQVTAYNKLVSGTSSKPKKSTSSSSKTRSTSKKSTSKK